MSVTFPEGCPNAGRPVVVYGGTEQQRTLLPVRTLVSAVDAHGNIVDDVSGRLSFKLLPESGSLNSPSCKPTATLPLEGSSLKAVLRNGETVLDSPLLLQTSKKGAAPPGSYCLHVLSTLARRSVRGVVAFTLTGTTCTPFYCFIVFVLSLLDFYVCVLEAVPYNNSCTVQVINASAPVFRNARQRCDRLGECWKGSLRGPVR